jgi:HlyD family secretion protein
VALAGAAYFLLDPGDDDGLPEGLVMGNGRVEAVQVDISTKLPGSVAEVLVAEGDLVEVGQAVARMDVVQLEAQLLRAEAEINSALAEVTAAEAQVLVARSELSLAEKRLGRTEELLARGNASFEAHDIDVTQRNVALAGVAGAEAALAARRKAVDAARAVAAEIASRIEDAELASPVFGRVLYRLAEPGEVLGTGGKIVTLIDYEDIFMEIFLPASQAHLVNIGAEARIKLDIWDFGIPAKVSFVSPESQFTPKQVETPSERDKLMFRIKIRADEALIRHNVERVKAGLRGVAYVHLDGFPAPDWSALLPDMPPEALPQAVETDGT